VYAVKECYRTIQGEGVNAGRPAVFVRFAGCNLWSGREADRGTATCRFCDTDFVGIGGPGGGRYGAAELARKASEFWGSDRESRFVVLTGGEPMLQVDAILVDAFHRFGFEVAIETNGTVEIPFHSLDWITVSPKAGAAMAQRCGQELKLVFPQPGLDPVGFLDMPFRHFCLQPMSGPDLAGNTRLAVEYCRDHPAWRLSVQVHKFIGIA
jgi:7-carboxy-7-deazaguanine synthase